MNNFDIYTSFCEFAKTSKFYKDIVDALDNEYKTNKMGYTTYLDYLKTYIRSEEDIEKYFNHKRNK